jgi:hypothetical protein
MAKPLRNAAASRRVKLKPAAPEARATQRPRTRAWIKQDEEQKRKAMVAPSTSQLKAGTTYPSKLHYLAAQKIHPVRTRKHLIKRGANIA